MRSSDQALNILLPVTRPWTREAVCAAIADSDIPRGTVILVLDAPGCERWAPALEALGFTVSVHATGNPTPPAGRLERRERHLAMRRLTQGLVPDGPLLCLEDDTIVPPDVYTLLTAAGPTATGVQVGRWGGRIGVWTALGMPRTCGAGIEQVRACGLYCLYTTGEQYRAPFRPGSFGGAIDAAQTAPMRPRVVWDCVCGHLTDGGVLWPQGYSSTA